MVTTLTIWCEFVNGNKIVMHIEKEYVEVVLWRKEFKVCQPVEEKDFWDERRRFPREQFEAILKRITDQRTRYMEPCWKRHGV